MGCRVWGRTESDIAEAMQQQQQQILLGLSRRGCSAALPGTGHL